MEEYNYYDILCDSISSLRKQKEMTQEQVAGQLGISKWESKRSCPDIGLLPQIARMFDTTHRRPVWHSNRVSAAAGRIPGADWYCREPPLAG